MLEKNPWVSIKLLKTSLTSEVSDHFIEDVCMSNQGEVSLLEVYNCQTWLCKKGVKDCTQLTIIMLIFRITDHRFGSSSYIKLLNFLPFWV